MGSTMFGCGADEILIFEEDAARWATEGGGPVVVNLRDGTMQPLQRIYRKPDGSLRIVPSPSELLNRDVHLS